MPLVWPQEKGEKSMQQNKDLVEHDTELDITAGAKRSSPLSPRTPRPWKRYESVDYTYRWGGLSGCLAMLLQWRESWSPSGRQGIKRKV